MTATMIELISNDYIKTKIEEDRVKRPELIESTLEKIASELERWKSEKVWVAKGDHDPFYPYQILDEVFNISPFANRRVDEASHRFHKVFMKASQKFLGLEWWFARYLSDTGREVHIAYNHPPKGCPIASGMRFRVFKKSSEDPSGGNWELKHIASSYEEAVLKRDAFQQQEEEESFFVVEEFLYPTRRLYLKPGHRSRSFVTGKYEKWREVPVLDCPPDESW